METSKQGGLKPRERLGRLVTVLGVGVFLRHLRLLRGRKLAILPSSPLKIQKHIGWTIYRTVERLVRGRHCKGINLNQRGETLAVPLLLVVHRV